MRCVGYRQAWEFLEGRIDAAGLRAKGIAATRQLAKRQLTWLRSMPATTFDPSRRASPSRSRAGLEACTGAAGRPQRMQGNECSMLSC